METPVEHARSSCICAPGSEVWVRLHAPSSVAFSLQNRIVQREVSHQLLESSVLTYELLELPGLIQFESAVLLPPRMEHLLDNSNLLARLRNQLALGNLNLHLSKLVLQRFRVSVCSVVNRFHAHQMTSSKSMTRPEYSLLAWIDIRGAGQLEALRKQMEAAVDSPILFAGRHKVSIPGVSLGRARHIERGLAIPNVGVCP